MYDLMMLCELLMCEKIIELEVEMSKVWIVNVWFDDDVWIVDVWKDYRIESQDKESLIDDWLYE